MRDTCYCSARTRRLEECHMILTPHPSRQCNHATPISQGRIIFPLLSFRLLADACHAQPVGNPHLARHMVFTPHTAHVCASKFLKSHSETSACANKSASLFGNTPDRRPPRDALKGKSCVGWSRYLKSDLFVPYSWESWGSYRIVSRPSVIRI